MFANRVAGLNFNVIEYFANGMSGLWTRRVHLCPKSVLLKFCWEFFLWVGKFVKKC